MKIAVVIPSFNQGKYISEAIESIIQQSHPVDEILVVDDASIDDTCQIIKNKFPQVRLLINNTNRGPSYSRNYGIESSTSDLITFLDADDLWPEDKIQWQYDYLIQNSTIDMVAGYGDYFFSEKVSKNDLRRHYLEGKPHFNAYLGSFLIKRSVFDRVGMFDVEMRLSEDQDWFMRTREAGVALKIKENISLRKRVHDANTTDGLSFKNSGFIQALRNSIRRREEINDNLKSNL
ncbi:MAG: glycosyltransferase involved in cell wall biosynthesis [Sediminicola sp.]|jgi:glycosyltransferase involved in cell wall biosynthesis|tara:strand:+ start:3137 stop:3838 length:702 start_codon:yes stop_codon:yes gene_type:complete